MRNTPREPLPTGSESGVYEDFRDVEADLRNQAANGKKRGSDLDSITRRQLIQLAIRLKRYGGELYGVIGGAGLIPGQGDCLSSTRG